MANHVKTATASADDAPRQDPEELGLDLGLELVPFERTPFVARTAREPSRRLMLAVLADAVATFRRTASVATRADARTFAETAHWFASDDATEPFGFLAICAALGLDAAYLRQGLKSVRARARLARRECVLH